MEVVCLPFLVSGAHGFNVKSVSPTYIAHADVSDGRDTSAPPDEEFWIDDHFQQTLETLVRKFVEAANKLYVAATINVWRSLFQASEASMGMDEDHFVASAKCFLNDFYFQCMAIRTFKKVAGDIKKAAKEATDRVQRIETKF